MKDYSDILHLPHHVSLTHPQMPRGDRAAQFAPFAALTGFEGVIDEAGRLTEERPEQDEARLEELDALLHDRLLEGGEITLLLFEADEKKEGGRYVRVTGTVKKVDGESRTLVFGDGRRIAADRIVEIL